MSKFRERAAEIKAAGEAERGNFTPHGAPKRLYDYWLKNTRSDHGKAVRSGRRKENFCHYWRVVALWAPLMKLREGLTAAAPVLTVGLAAVLIALFIYACIVSNDVLMVALTVAGGLIACAMLASGLIGGVSLALEDDDERIRNEMPDFKTAVIMSLIGLPTAILGYLAVRAVAFYKRRLTEFTPHILVGLIALGALAAATLTAASEGIGFLLIIVAGLIGALLVTALLIWMGAAIGEYLQGRRKVREAAASEARLAQRNTVTDPFAEPREPGRISKFFRAVGDFLILVSQVIRVNKWKICPTVEIDVNS